MTSSVALGFNLSRFNAGLAHRTYCQEWEAVDVKEWAKPFYKSKAWQDCREAFFIFRHGLCERCGGPGKIVHHKIYLTPQNINDPNISLNWDNLELVCQDCHNEEHHSTDAVADGLMFDENGDLVDNPKKRANNM